MSQLQVTKNNLRFNFSTLSRSPQMRNDFFLLCIHATTLLFVTIPWPNFNSDLIGTIPCSGKVKPLCFSYIVSKVIRFFFFWGGGRNLNLRQLLTQTHSSSSSFLNYVNALPRETQLNTAAVKLYFSPSVKFANSRIIQILLACNNFYTLKENVHQTNQTQYVFNSI